MYSLLLSAMARKEGFVVKKRLLMVVLALVVLIGALTLTASAATVVASGLCGDNLVWVLDSDGVLTISGEGEMADYDFWGGVAPWYSYREEITEAVIEKGVTSIGECTFFRCTALVSVTIPDSVTFIDESAFLRCTALTSIAIPDSVTRIDIDAFSNCTSLTDVYITDLAAWCKISFGNPVSNPMVNGARLWLNGELVSALVIPEGVTSIGSSAFSGCTSLTSVVIPGSVDSIGQSAFDSCTNLSSVSIGDGVTFIDYFAFEYCTSLTSVVIPDSVTRINGNTFSGCTSLTSAVVSAGLKEIHGVCVFQSCESLDFVVFKGPAPSLKGSGMHFRNITTTVYYPCDGTWPESNFVKYSDRDQTWVPSHNFVDGVCKNCGITGGSCGSDVFWSLDEDSVLTIYGFGSMTDYGADNPAPWYAHREAITQVIIHSGVTSIGSYAFAGYNNQTSVDIPRTVANIGVGAFDSVGSMTNFGEINTYTTGMFGDVVSNSWYETNVARSYELGLMKGTGEAAFSPTKNITIAEVITMAARIHSIYMTGSAEFAQGAPWYQVYVDYAIENGIIGPNSYSNYNALATRAMCAAILGAAVPESELQAINNITVIPDVTQDTGWGKAVYRLYNAGVLTGTDASGTFAPAKHITRAEVATIATRIVDASLRKSYSIP
jgi:hypothetical protein